MGFLLDFYGIVVVFDSGRPIFGIFMGFLWDCCGGFCHEQTKNVAWLDLILHKVLMPFYLVLREDVLKSLDIFVVINFLFLSEILCP